MTSLLARFAENYFWMARYVERAENLARILDVNETFARDETGEQDWLPIVQLNADGDKFFKRYSNATAASVTAFYITDIENPNSILCTIRAAHENARSLRHLISIEVWTEINMFYAWLRKLTRRDITLNRLSSLCGEIKERCQLHTGIVEGTLYRDQGAIFYRLGRCIERADQITRLVDIKYHSLKAKTADTGSGVDVSQWNALLRSAAAYHGYRRAYPRGMNRERVAGFLLFDAGFPRSLRTSVREIHHLVAELHEELSEPENSAPQETLRKLAQKLETSVDMQSEEALHAYLDDIQLLLLTLGSGLAEKYFPVA